MLTKLLILICTLLLVVRAGFWSGVVNLYNDIREKQRIVETEFLENKAMKKLKGLEDDYVEAKKRYAEEKIHYDELEKMTTDDAYRTVR